MEVWTGVAELPGKDEKISGLLYPTGLFKISTGGLEFGATDCWIIHC